jgi:hypothetical protein
MFFALSFNSKNKKQKTQEEFIKLRAKRKKTRNAEYYVSHKSPTTLKTLSLKTTPFYTLQKPNTIFSLLPPFIINKAK